MTNMPYTYTVLRYVHDTATAEFVNVGVVLHCAKTNTLGAKFRHTHRRLSSAFPDLDAAAFRSAMVAIERTLKIKADSYKSADLFRSDTDALAMARSVLPADDSSLQWSPVGSGLTSDPATEIDRLFIRLVGSYDERHEHRRTDADVWRPVRERLDKAKMASKLQEKVIRGEDDVLEFKHAWKNELLWLFLTSNKYKYSQKR